MPNIDTANILASFLKNDPHFNSDEVLESNKTCFDEDDNSSADKDDLYDEEDFIAKINQKSKQVSVPEVQEQKDIPIEIDSEEAEPPVSLTQSIPDEDEQDKEETDSKTSLIEPPVSTPVEQQAVPMTKEERKAAILKQKSLEEKIERDRLAFEEEIRKKEEELIRIKSEKSRPKFGLFTKAPIKVKRDRDNIEEEKLRLLALFDQKLHCKNANAYSIEVNTSSAPKKDSLTFIFCDINNLKKINDANGHEAGDALLTACVDKLIARFTANQIYRIGGDEFCILYHPQENTPPVEQLLEEDLLLLAKLNPLYSFSYGYSISDGTKSIAELQKDADAKMYMYKEAYKLAHQESIPKNDKIKTVKDVISKMVIELKRSEDEIANIFICTYSDKLFIFDVTLDFYDLLEEGRFNKTGKNQIKYCLITYDDNKEDYLVLTEEPSIENPYPLLKNLDNDIRSAREFTDKNVKAHKELNVFKEIYLA